MAWNLSNLRFANMTFNWFYDIPCRLRHFSFEATDTIIEMDDKTSELNLILIQMLIAYVIFFMLLSTCYLIHRKFDLFGTNIRQHSPASVTDSVLTSNTMHIVSHSTRPNDDSLKGNNSDEKSYDDDDDIILAYKKSSEVYFVWRGKNKYIREGL